MNNNHGQLEEIKARKQINNNYQYATTTNRDNNYMQNANCQENNGSLLLILVSTFVINIAIYLIIFILSKIDTTTTFLIDSFLCTILSFVLLAKISNKELKKHKNQGCIETIISAIIIILLTNGVPYYLCLKRYSIIYDSLLTIACLIPLIGWTITMMMINNLLKQRGKKNEREKPIATNNYSQIRQNLERTEIKTKEVDIVRVIVLFVLGAFGYICTVGFIGGALSEEFNVVNSSGDGRYYKWK